MLDKLEQILIEITSSSIPTNDEIARENVKRHQIDCLHAEIGAILWSSSKQSEIFNASFRPALGHLISILLDAFTNSKLDVEVRIKCGDSLAMLTAIKYKEMSADFMAFILPGVFAACQKNLIGTTTQIHSQEIVRNSSQILSNILLTAFSNMEQIKAADTNESPDDAKRLILNFKRTAKWTKEAAQKIIAQLSFLLSKLCAQNVDLLRLEAVQITTQIYESGIFGDEFTKIAFDTISILLNDPFPKTQNTCKQLLSMIQSNKQFMESHGIQKLTKSIKMLEKDAQNSTTNPRQFQNFINLIEMLGPELVNRLFASPDFTTRFTSAFLSVICVDTGRQLISCSHAQETGLPSLPPLKFGIDAKQVAGLARLLLQLDDFENLFDHLIDDFEASTVLDRKIAIAFFINAMARANCSRNASLNKLYKFLDNILDMLKTMEPAVEEEVQDHRLEENLPVNTEESCLVQLLLNCLAQLDFEQISARDSPDLLFEVLKWCASSNYALREAAQQCLAQLSKNSISTFLLKNAHRIMFKVSLASRDFAQHPRFPLVIAEMVSRCPNPKMYGEVRATVDEVLFWLDRSDQCRTLLLLRALRNYSRALVTWFPDLIPTSSSAHEEEEDEEVFGANKGKKNDVNYPLIANAVTILNRTKHFISSPSFPARLLVLDILHASLQLVRNYEDDLLPMVHQNWHGLVRLLGDPNHPGLGLTESQKVVAARAVKVVECICELSNDFVYWKIAKEFLPRAVALLNQLLAKVTREIDKINKYSVSYKLQFAIVESSATAVNASQVSDEFLEPLRLALQRYADCNKLDDDLREKAKKSLAKIKH